MRNRASGNNGNDDDGATSLMALGHQRYHDDDDACNNGPSASNLPRPPVTLSPTAHLVHHMTGRGQRDEEVATTVTRRRECEGRRPCRNDNAATRSAGRTPRVR
ncbi:hypothetical protein OG21DRAFT_1329238 [Imleria badia]|nr:hypothetical protein OG21DRAFT_1329238 [Imleria badia]